jgi:hypothetical protein
VKHPEWARMTPEDRAIASRLRIQTEHPNSDFCDYSATKAALQVSGTATAHWLADGKCHDSHCDMSIAASRLRHSGIAITSESLRAMVRGMDK